MKLGDILQSNAIKVLASSSSKKRLFQDLGELAETCYGLDTEQVVTALLERESLGPTGVGHGVALPHARMDGIDSVQGMFIRLEKPMDFDAIDRQPVDLVFALLAPAHAGVDHLKALALVSRTMRDQNVLSKLRANSDPATLHTILTDAPATQLA
ncbi:PTS sugar transporter subunit IIA [Ketogulonicigenium vulgare]|uniref:Phosphoenolpyruvate-dependent sugar phosphotransferase system, EIIA 2, putative n=1 Tax=Ketogulonicigenium vulgare (strain WSH-001) TaxID=759362 RepID=F9Y5V5_KETVW|nr:PTS sugar transporter subunit IIA [Ketogulonicigenium vulgare]ADO43765.1 PTS IIA-like nitrogen-regulatory protein PtsN [Ketogulonicigenium vulgare Y25]AEM42030.1 Phosphoenolpyruvate-dependent sugar phosphotransferase system, EIIA 2, putative [Ketogulonicigenium vulgare WSH-001]ALJ82125.1 PTS lactose transporter subunit IIC [Ketogulonicigenium vulgare]ANW34748.1 PTS lactose transporter subunit IIC [Ketogulonicigenium vulgare]AOZ55798.1 PTS IIA-like nitrogen-regulatory protein PtsN [Ketogulon